MTVSPRTALVAWFVVAGVFGIGAVLIDVPWSVAVAGLVVTGFSAAVVSNVWGLLDGMSSMTANSRTAGSWLFSSALRNRGGVRFIFVVIAMIGVSAAVSGLRGLLP